MLSKLENLYLDALRIAMLAIATLALVVFGLNAINFTTSMGALSPQPPTPLSNGTVTLEQFLQSTQSGQSPVQNGAAQTVALPHPLHEAAEHVTEIYRRVSCEGNCYGTDREVLTSTENHLETFKAGLDPAYQEQYERSILAFTTALADYRGRPLNVDSIGDAIAFHNTTFLERVHDKEFAATEQHARAVQTLTIAALSFATFLAILFFFVVVKIERNLRVVKTEPMAPV